MEYPVCEVGLAAKVRPNHLERQPIGRNAEAGIFVDNGGVHGEVLNMNERGCCSRRRNQLDGQRVRSTDDSGWSRLRLEIEAGDDVETDELSRMSRTRTVGVLPICCPSESLYVTWLSHWPFSRIPRLYPIDIRI